MKTVFRGLAAVAALAYSLLPLGAAEPRIGAWPEPEADGSFSMIMIPDPQSYTKFAANQPLFELQTAWAAQHLDRLRVKAVLFTGDMVEQNNKLIAAALPNADNGDQTSAQQWKAVSRALERLDNKVPYIVCQGNHDAGEIASENRFSHLPDVVYPERNSAWEKTLVATCPNYQGIHTMENAAFEFTDPNWGPMLVIAFEFAPRDAALDWARNLIASDRFRSHRVIILTHSFLNHKNEIIEKERYRLAEPNWPRAVWDKLVAPSRNIDLILCGHAGVDPRITWDNTDVSQIDYTPNCGFRVEAAADGRKVPIMMFNSQTGDGEWNGNGGDCWVRLLEFLPDGRTVKVRTFSPFFAQSKLTNQNAWRTAPYDQFSFTVPGK